MGICESKPASESKGVNEGVPPDDRVDHLVLTMMGVLHCNWFLFKVFSRYAQASCKPLAVAFNQTFKTFSHAGPSIQLVCCRPTDVLFIRTIR